MTLDAAAAAGCGGVVASWPGLTNQSTRHFLCCVQEPHKELKVTVFKINTDWRNLTHVAQTRDNDNKINLLRMMILFPAYEEKLNCIILTGMKHDMTKPDTGLLKCI